MQRREFLQTLAAAAVAVSASGRASAKPARAFRDLYDLPAYGNVHLLHFTDCHAQLQPIHFREPTVNIGVAEATNRAPHLVGKAFLKQLTAFRRPQPTLHLARFRRCGPRLRQGRRLRVPRHAGEADA
jgi:sulfur-oxidizing protein SoxB